MIIVAAAAPMNVCAQPPLTPLSDDDGAMREITRRSIRNKPRYPLRIYVQNNTQGLTRALLARMLGASGERLADARNRALLALAYDTLLRRGELVAVQVSDIVVECDGAGTVLVRRSKADPEGLGEMVYVAPDTMALVGEWLGRSGVGEGRVFRSLARGVLGEGLEAGQVPRIFKRMARSAGLAGELVERISGHSTRVGAAQDMVAGGIALPAIQHAGRWKSAAMVHRYGERLLARRSGAAQLARLQQRVPSPAA